MFEADRFAVLVGNWVDMLLLEQTSPLGATTGGAPVLTRDSSHAGLGVRTTGEITRGSAFVAAALPPQAGAPGICQVTEVEQVRRDNVLDQMGLVIDNRGEGLLVLTRCTHAGVVNTIKQARRIYGEKRIRAVRCGFHLGFPTTVRETVGLIPATSQENNVRTLMPMRRRGLHTHAHVADDPKYLQPSADTMLRFRTSAMP